MSSSTEYLKYSNIRNMYSLSFLYLSLVHCNSRSTRMWYPLSRILTSVSRSLARSRYNNSGAAPVALSPRFGKYVRLNLLRTSIAISAISTQSLTGTEAACVCVVHRREAAYTPLVKGQPGAEARRGAAWRGAA